MNQRSPFLRAPWTNNIHLMSASPAVGHWVLLAALLWVGSYPVLGAGPSQIIPGRSVGRVRLGEAAAQAMRPLGAAEKSDGASGRFWDVWALPALGWPGHPVASGRYVSGRYEMDVSTVRDEDGQHKYVEQVRVTSPWFTTHRGIRVGSRLRAVLVAFPRARLVRPRVVSARHQAILLYDDVGEGITFEFPAPRRGIPASERCRAILVHPRRRGVLREYYPWYIPGSDGALHNAL